MLCFSLISLVCHFITFTNTAKIDLPSFCCRTKEQRDLITKSFYGEVRRFIRHKVTTYVLLLEVLDDDINVIHLMYVPEVNSVFCFSECPDIF